MSASTSGYERTTRGRTPFHQVRIHPQSVLGQSNDTPALLTWRCEAPGLKQRRFVVEVRRHQVRAFVLRTQLLEPVQRGVDLCTRKAPVTTGRLEPTREPTADDPFLGGVRRRDTEQHSDLGCGHRFGVGPLGFGELLRQVGAPRPGKDSGQLLVVSSADQQSVHLGRPKLTEDIEASSESSQVLCQHHH